MLYYKLRLKLVNHSRFTINVKYYNVSLHRHCELTDSQKMNPRQNSTLNRKADIISKTM